MNNSQIDRINELYRKSQSEGLTEEEKEEQLKLRSEYIANIRRNLRGTLEQVSFVNPDGSITKAKDRKKNKEEE
ncbi:DUF896 domain-containing protein [Mobilitalea sibirica]|uniref:UPF0291 protein I5677_11225 n=1 Tax=Mobilitalea sibirica TaxID=1462919 RepID=A0A8J7HE09_9FIRM|nr:DUF896 domain-containing protein [Mobilitalea sibirica]MBH1941464.1 DUF896 domain-containing protein [Mobilitalea sibirica]